MAVPLDLSYRDPPLAPKLISHRDKPVPMIRTRVIIKTFLVSYNVLHLTAPTFDRQNGSPEEISQICASQESDLIARQSPVRSNHPAGGLSADFSYYPSKENDKTEKKAKTDKDDVIREA